MIISGNFSINVRNIRSPLFLTTLYENRFSHRKNMANFGLKFKEKLYQIYKSKFEQKMGHKFDSEFVPKGDDVETESGYKVDPEFERTFDKVIHGMNSNNYASLS